jgi:hypothetical protein
MMIQTTKKPLKFCDSLPQLGGFSRLRIVESRNIVQQEFQTDTELDALCFLRSETFLASFGYADNFMGDLKMESLLVDFGVDEKYGLKSIHEVDAEPAEFKVWYNRNIKGQRFALELTNNNGFVRLMNPFMITYSYIGTSEFSNLNRYELQYSRVRLVEFPLKDFKVIKQINARTINYALVPGTEATIILYEDATPSLFDFGYSTQNEFETIIFQNTPASPVIHQLADGVYYFFAVNRACPAFYDSVQATILAGEVTITEPESINPQIITDNETSIDKGITMPE